jgi:hypothetical protein
MILNSTIFTALQDFFKAYKQMNDAWTALNKTTTAIMGKKLYSNETKKVWRIINAYECGPFKGRHYKILLEDLSSPPNGFFSKQRWKYGWKQPHLWVPVDVLEDKIKKGILSTIEYE